MRNQLLSHTRRAALAALTLLVGIAGCSEPSSSPMAPTRPATFIGDGLFLVQLLTSTTSSVLAQVVGPEGAVIQIAGGHSITFPAGALPDSVTITAVRDDDDLMVRFEPEGLVFPDSARPVLTFDYSGSETESAVIVYLSDSGWLREVLPTQIDPNTHVARAELRHFSTYALATD